MAAHSRGRGRGTRGRAGLPKARVEWLPNPDSKLVGSLPPGTLQLDTTIYDFSKATQDDVTAKFGAGDWTVERLLFSAGAFPQLGTSPPAGESAKLIRICFSIGMLNTALSAVAPGFSSANLASAIDDPQVSWMMRVCCFISLGQFEVTKCEFDLGRSRRIGADSRIVAQIEIGDTAGEQVPDSDPTNGTTIRFNADMRVLVRQRGSRL